MVTTRQLGVGLLRSRTNYQETYFSTVCATLFPVQPKNRTRRSFREPSGGYTHGRISGLANNRNPGTSLFPRVSRVFFRLVSLRITPSTTFCTLDLSSLLPLPAVLRPILEVRT
jgi:hypothetical protein